MTLRARNPEPGSRRQRGFFDRPKQNRPRRKHARERTHCLEWLERRVLLCSEVNGYVWEDLTGDGFSDDDTPIVGQSVNLYLDNGDGQFNPATDALAATGTTDATGRYSFSPTTGTYFLQQVLPAGWTQTAGPSYYTVPVSTATFWDGGIFDNFRLGEIRGQKFNDSNGNGLKDTGESGLAGWSIFIDSSGDGVLNTGETSAVTDSQGNYVLSGVGPGTRLVREVPQAAWVPTSPTTSGWSVSFGGSYNSNKGAAISSISDSDDATQFQALSFSFLFAGTNYTGIYISSNGFLWLGGDGGGGCCSESPADLLADFPRIAPFATDLDTARAGTVYFNDLGDRALVTWEAVASFAGASESNTFQAQLFPNGEIVFSYSGITLPHSTATPVLVGVVPAQTEILPSETELGGELPFDTLGQPAVYQYVRSAMFERWDLDSSSIRFAPSTAAGSYSVSLTSGQVMTGKDFGARAAPAAPAFPDRISELNDRVLTAGTSTIYNYTAQQEGVVTVQLFFMNMMGNLDLELRDQAGNVLASSTGTMNEERVNVMATTGQQFQIRAYSPMGAGNTYDVKVTNALNRRTVPSGSELVLSASNADDVITVGQNAAGMGTADVRDLKLAGAAFRHETRYDATILNPVLGSSAYTSMLVRGRRGHDRITVDPSVTLPANVYGNAGNDTVTGGSGDDYIAGGADNDSLDGAAGNDFITTGMGNSSAALDGTNSATGGAGNDTFVSGAGSETLDGGTGVNTCLQGGSSTGSQNCRTHDRIGSGWVGTVAGGGSTTMFCMAMCPPGAQPPVEICTNGIDDDYDGKTDQADEDCPPSSGSGDPGGTGDPDGTGGSNPPTTPGASVLAEDQQEPQGNECLEACDAEDPGGDGEQVGANLCECEADPGDGEPGDDGDESGDGNADDDGRSNRRSLGSRLRSNRLTGSPVQSLGLPGVGGVGGGSSGGGSPLRFVDTGRLATGTSVVLARIRIDSATPPALTTLNLMIGGIAFPPVYYNTSGLSSGATFRVALPYDATLFTTERYPYTVTVSPPGTAASINGKINIVNGYNPIGAGWTLNLLERIHSTSDGAMLVMGDGTTRFFPGSGAAGSIYGHGTGNFSTLVRNADSTYTRTLADGTKHHYATSGVITSQVRLDDRGTTFEYEDFNGDGSPLEISKIRDATGRITTFVYVGGYLSTVTDPAGRVTTFQHDSYGNVTSVTLPDTSRWDYYYAGPTAPRRLQRIVAPRQVGQPLESWEERLTYDLTGRVSRWELRNSATGSVLNWEEIVSPESRLMRDASGTPTISSPTNPYQPVLVDFDVAEVKHASSVGPDHTVKYRLDRLGNISEVIESDETQPALPPRKATYERDGDGLLKKITDPLGLVTEFAYDFRGNVTQITQPDPDGTGPLSPPVWRYSYDVTLPFARVQTITDPEGAVTTFWHSTLGQLTQVREPMKNDTFFSYDTRGNLKTVTDALSRTTTLNYDVHDRVTSIVQPDFTTLGFAYDTADNLISFTDERNLPTTFEYDNLGRTTRVTDPLGRHTDFLYDKMGNLTQVTDNAGAVTRLTYDAMNRVTKISEPDPVASVWSYSYNSAGVPVSATDPLGRVTSYGYDIWSRLVSVTDPASAVTQFLYDLGDRVTRVTNPIGAQTLFQYDALARLTQLTEPDPDGGGSQSPPLTTYRYDSVGRLLQETDPQGGITTYLWYADGNLRQVTRPGNVTHRFFYDAVGNLTKFRDDLGHDTRFGYDAMNRLVTRTDEYNGVYTWMYNQGVLESERDELSHSTSYGYDAAGQVISLTGPLPQQVTQIGYDPVGRVQSVTDPLNRITTWTFDAAGRLTQITEPDPDGPGGVAPPVWSYSYDAAHQLTGVTDPLLHTTGYAYCGLCPQPKVTLGAEYHHYCQGAK